MPQDFILRGLFAAVRVCCWRAPANRAGSGRSKVSTINPVEQSIESSISPSPRRRAAERSEGPARLLLRGVRAGRSLCSPARTGEKEQAASAAPLRSQATDALAALALRLHGGRLAPGDRAAPLRLDLARFVGGERRGRRIAVLPAERPHRLDDRLGMRGDAGALWPRPGCADRAPSSRRCARCRSARPARSAW